MTASATQDWLRELSASEQELLREVTQALRSIRYGSIVIAVHEAASWK